MRFTTCMKRFIDTFNVAFAGWDYRHSELVSESMTLKFQYSTKKRLERLNKKNGKTKQ